VYEDDDVDEEEDAHEGVATLWRPPLRCDRRQPSRFASAPLSAPPDLTVSLFPGTLFLLTALRVLTTQAACV
jgi:hypothetical protein